jgi:HSP90 family molecular chaperone
MEDEKNKKKLLPLLRFASSSSDSLTSLDGYVKRMKGKQTQIYYISAASLDEAKKSPVAEVAIARYELLNLFLILCIFRFFDLYLVDMKFFT